MCENGLIKGIAGFGRYKISGLKHFSDQEALESGAVDGLNMLFNRPAYLASRFDEQAMVLREDKFGGRYLMLVGSSIDEAIEKYLSPQSWSRPWQSINAVKEKQGLIDRVVMSKTGYALFRDGTVSLDELCYDFLDPRRFDGRKIGSGSEGDVYAFNIGKKEFAIKLFNAQTQERLNSYARMFHIHYLRPVFYQRIGFTDSIAKDLRTLPVTFSLSAPVEYWASRDYIVTEYLPMISVKDLFVVFGLEQDSKAKTKEARQFITERKVKKSAVIALQKELFRLYAAGTIQRFLNFGFIGKEKGLSYDFSATNFLVSDYDRGAGTFSLVLIGQGQEPVLSERDPYYTELNEHYNAKEAYKRLVRQSTYRPWLKEHDVKVGLENWKP